MTNHNYKDLSWTDDANCIKPGAAHPDTWYPPRDKDRYKPIADEAKKHCFGGDGWSACSVRHMCLWQAIDTDEQHGIWGGLSHRERNAMVRKWQKMYRHQMTLQEYVFQHKEKENGNS